MASRQRARVDGLGPRSCFNTRNAACSLLKRNPFEGEAVLQLEPPCSEKSSRLGKGMLPDVPLSDLILLIAVSK